MTRLLIWGIVLAVCLFVVGLQLSTSRTVLDRQTLGSWFDQGNGYEKLRDAKITPQIIRSIKESDIEGVNFISDDMIRHATTATLTPEVMREKFSPALDSVAGWIDSKNSDISFSISVESERKTFIQHLSREVVTGLRKIPICTYLNTFEDAAEARCRLSTFVPETLATSITDELNSTANSIPVISGTLTESTFELPASVTAKTRHIPNYLNMLWAASLVAAGVLVLATIWLLVKHRGNGLLALGGGSVVGGIGLVIAAGVVRQASWTNDTAFQSLQTAASQSIAGELTRNGTLAIGIGVVCLMVGVGVGLLLRRHKTGQRLHLQAPRDE